MALMDHAETDPDEDEGTGPGGKPTPKDAKKKKRDNLLVIGIALVGVILTFLIWRSSKSSSSSASTTGNPVPSSGLLAGGSSSTNATDPNAEAGLAQLQNQFGQQSDALQGLQASLSTLTAEVAGLSNTPSGTSGTPPQAPAASPATPGYGYINLPGIGQSIILGSIGAGDQFTGYNVGGGAPVYFGNGNGASQGSGQETVGSYAYVPVAYASLVGNSPTQESLPGAH